MDAEDDDDDDDKEWLILSLGFFIFFSLFFFDDFWKEKNQWDQTRQNFSSGKRDRYSWKNKLWFLWSWRASMNLLPAISKQKESSETFAFFSSLLIENDFTIKNTNKTTTNLHSAPMTNPIREIVFSRSVSWLLTLCLGLAALVQQNFMFCISLRWIEWLCFEKWSDALYISNEVWTIGREKRQWTNQRKRKEKRERKRKISQFLSFHFLSIYLFICRWTNRNWVSGNVRKDKNKIVWSIALSHHLDYQDLIHMPKSDFRRSQIVSR